jgi:hypothetical protein
MSSETPVTPGLTAFDSRSHAKTPESILVARSDLVASLAGVPITIGEQQIVNWLLDWDQPLLHTLASIIRKARDCGPGQPS